MIRVRQLHHSLLAVLISTALSGCITALPRPSEEATSVIVAGEGVVRERPAVTPSGNPSPSKSAQMPASAKQRPPTPVAESNPTRKPAQVMRIWIAPWEDSAGNLHGASHVFSEVVPRRWSLASDTDTPATTVLTPLQIQPRQVSTSESERKP